MAGINCEICDRPVEMTYGMVILEGDTIMFSHEECLEMSSIEGSEPIRAIHEND
jgi:hypothetical protein